MDDQLQLSRALGGKPGKDGAYEHQHGNGIDQQRSRVDQHVQKDIQRKCLRFV
jgi:hypothetical protein